MPTFINVPVAGTLLRLTEWGTYQPPNTSADTGAEKSERKKGFICNAAVGAMVIGGTASWVLSPGLHFC